MIDTITEKKVMCGIVGAISTENVVPTLFEGLQKLEYRGYDSAGIVIINPEKQFRRHRTAGKIKKLEKIVNQDPTFEGTTGLAHTRWATHGVPDKKNAHPHIAGEEIAIVHNGIIENHANLREELIAAGCHLTSETDSELIAHLVHLTIQSGKDFLTSVQLIRKKLRGSYAIGLIHCNEPGRIIAVRSNSPLVIGLDLKKKFIASDQYALNAVAKKLIYLEEGDLADIRMDKVTIFDINNNIVQRRTHLPLTMANAAKGHYSHFMQKEIFEQDQAISFTLENRFTVETPYLTKRSIAVIGLGYVGLTLATALGKKQKIIGYDIDPVRIQTLEQHLDKNAYISSDELGQTDIQYTNHPDLLTEANFYIISVPTLLDQKLEPDLSMLIQTTETVGMYLKKGDIVVYESTVFPGVTEEICIPLLEATSKLKCHRDFGVGYSPERINPSDKVHHLGNIPKIISASDSNTLKIIADVYSTVVQSIYPVSSIRVAEATKLIENAQRDLNISFINEIALILHTFDMESAEVLAAARTKWNFLPFQPGFVGGHCISINSQYLIYKAEKSGFIPELIHAGRKVNEYMPQFIADQTIKQLTALGINLKKARVTILGFTYKENCMDWHDTKIFDLYNHLQDGGVQVFLHDPLIEAQPDLSLEGFNLVQFEDITQMDAIILSVPHQTYLELSKDQFEHMLKKPGLIIDIKGVLEAKPYENTGITLWRL